MTRVTVAFLALAIALLAGCGNGYTPKDPASEGFSANGKATQALIDLCQPHGGVLAYSLEFGHTKLYGATAICKDNTVVETD